MVSHLYSDAPTIRARERHTLSAVERVPRRLVDFSAQRLFQIVVGVITAKKIGETGYRRDTSGGGYSSPRYALRTISLFCKFAAVSLMMILPDCKM